MQANAPKMPHLERFLPRIGKSLPGLIRVKRPEVVEELVQESFWQRSGRTQFSADQEFRETFRSCLDKLPERAANVLMFLEMDEMRTAEGTESTVHGKAPFSGNTFI